MHTFSSVFGHPQIPNQASSSSYMSGKTCIVLEIRRFGENSALNSSGVHIFSCVFGRCLLTASKPQSCTVFKLRFGKTCIVFEIRRFGENSALNSSGVHIFLAFLVDVFWRPQSLNHAPSSNYVLGKPASSSRYAVSAKILPSTVAACIFFLAFLVDVFWRPQSLNHAPSSNYVLGKPASSSRYAVSAKILPSTVAACIFFLRFWSMSFDGLKSSIMHRLQTTFRENLHRLRDTPFRRKFCPQQ